MNQIGENPAIGGAAARAFALRKTETKEVEKVHPEHEESGTAEGASIKEFLIFIVCGIVIYAVISLLGKSKSAKKRGSAA